MKFTKLFKFEWMKKIVVRSSMSRKLLDASKAGDAEVIRSILNTFPEFVKFKFYRGKNTPLHVAAAKGYVEIVEILLQRGADVNATNGVGQTPLMLACRLGHMTIVQILLLYKPQIELVDDINGCNALHYAAGSGHVECLRLCLADYVPSFPLADQTYNMSHNDHCRYALNEIINSRAEGGITALHLANFYGKFECVRLLLNLGAWVDAISICDSSLETDVIGNRSSALHFAAFSGSRDCCQILLAYGADPTQRNSNGWTPRDVAKVRRHYLLDELLLGTSLTPADFPPSRYLAYPLMSIIMIAREIGLEYRDIVDSDHSEHFGRSVSTHTDTNENNNKCGICFERICIVESQSCQHQLCCHCALQLCCIGQSPIPSITPGSSTTTFSSSFSSSHSSSNLSLSSRSSTSLYPFQLLPAITERGESSNSSLSPKYLAGAILCPFCRTPITKFYRMRDLSFLGSDKNKIIDFSQEIDEDKEWNMDFSFTLSRPVDWSSLKLPNGKNLEEDTDEAENPEVCEGNVGCGTHQSPHSYGDYPVFRGMRNEASA